MIRAFVLLVLAVNVTALQIRKDDVAEECLFSVNKAVGVCAGCFAGAACAPGMEMVSLQDCFDMCTKASDTCFRWSVASGATDKNLAKKTEKVHDAAAEVAKKAEK